MFKKVLVAYDDSPASKKAFSTALDMAQKYSSELSIVSVIEGLSQYAEESVDEVKQALEQAQRHFEGVHRSAIAQAEHCGVKVTSHIVPGHAVEAVVHLAEEEKVDTIVLGALGHSKILRRASGGTGSLISYHAHCTVIIVR